MKDLTKEKQQFFPLSKTKQANISWKNKSFSIDGLNSTEMYNQNAEGNRNFREKVEAAIKALKKGKSAGVDNIPAKLVQAVGEAIMDPWYQS